MSARNPDLSPMNLQKAGELMHSIAWLYELQYKPMQSVDHSAAGRSHLFTQHELSTFHWIDAHPEAQQLMIDYIHHEQELQRQDAETLRIWEDGSIRTESEHVREVVQEQMREGIGIATENVFGAVGMIIGMRCYPDDPDMQNKTAALMANFGEVLLASGEVVHAHHEYNHYRPGDPFAPWYAPGPPTVDHPSLKPVGHDLPGHQTFNVHESHEGHSSAGHAGHESNEGVLDLGVAPEPLDAGAPMDLSSGHSGVASGGALEVSGHNQDYHSSTTFQPTSENQIPAAGDSTQFHAASDPSQFGQHAQSDANANFMDAHGNASHVAPLSDPSQIPHNQTDAHANFMDAHGNASHVAPLSDPSQIPHNQTDAHAADMHGHHGQAHGHAPVSDPSQIPHNQTDANANMTDPHGHAVHVDADPHQIPH